MKSALYLLLLVGFLLVDFLFFHDLFKPGEVTSLAQYLTGLLSLPVIAYSAQQLMASQPVRSKASRKHV
ncbi:MAG: hypothetical protein ABI221_03930 [Candidatus Saccharimonadales bacterium]